MTVCLLTISDGRHEYHHRALASALEQLPKFDAYVFVEDPEHRLGFAGAVAEGWRRALATGCDHVFHFEADFIFPAPVPVSDMIALLDRRPELVQVALKRQPVNAQEAAAGGFMEQYPDAYEQRADAHAVWTITRRNVTTNPAVWPRWVLERGWPERSESEGHFGIDLFGEYWGWAAFWGGKGDPPACLHIGDIRAGRGY